LIEGVCPHGGFDCEASKAQAHGTAEWSLAGSSSAFFAPTAVAHQLWHERRVRQIEQGFPDQLTVGVESFDDDVRIAQVGSSEPLDRLEQMCNDYTANQSNLEFGIPNIISRRSKSPSGLTSSTRALLYYS